MPTLRVATGTSTNALTGLTFNTIPAGGAIVNAFVSSATNGDVFGLLIGDRSIVTQGTECNVEIAADVVDVSRDQMVFNEVVGPGELKMPCTVTTELQAIIHIRSL